MKVRSGSPVEPKVVSELPDLRVRGDLSDPGDSFGSSGGSSDSRPARSWSRILSGAKTAVLAVALATSFATGSAEAQRHQVHAHAPFAQVSAGVPLAPPPFEVEGLRAVFVDFRGVKAELAIDATSGAVEGRARVEFEQPQAGSPILDLVHSPERVWVDGAEVPASSYRVVEAPDGVARLRLLGMELPPGRHQLEVAYHFDSNGRYAQGAEVQAGVVTFETSLQDHFDRGFSERFLPSNYEFDSYPTELTIRLRHTSDTSHQVVSNGSVTKLSPFEFRVDFPSTFTTSSPYLRLLGGKDIVVTHFEFESIDGRKIPIELATWQAAPTDFVFAEIERSLRDAEQLFGPYAHPKLLIDMLPSRAGGGGMEYAGAANVRTVSAVRHEVGHMWIGRGAMPADGRAGIIDEMLVEWFGRGSPSVAELSTLKDGLPKLKHVFGGESAYDRGTNQEAYRTGLNLVAYLNETLEGSGGLAPRLSAFYQRFAGKTFTVEDFVAALHQGASVQESAAVNGLLAQVGLTPNVRR